MRKMVLEFNTNKVKQIIESLTVESEASWKFLENWHFSPILEKLM